MSDMLLIGSCEPFSGKSAFRSWYIKRLLQEEKKYVLVNHWQHVSTY